ncbi:MAG: hypothetical protein MK193_09955 [Lentisphaeria bacterium]|nr:hypothetical protein [Lentisphaeria bacterium]
MYWDKKTLKWVKQIVALILIFLCLIFIYHTFSFVVNREQYKEIGLPESIKDNSELVQEQDATLIHNKITQIEPVDPDWSRKTYILKAADLLIQQKDLENAFALLERWTPKEPEAAEIVKRTIESMEEQARNILKSEVPRLVHLYKSMDQVDQYKLFASERSKRSLKLTQLLNEKEIEWRNFFTNLPIVYKVFLRVQCRIRLEESFGAQNKLVTSYLDFRLPINNQVRVILQKIPQLSDDLRRSSPNALWAHLLDQTILLEAFQHLLKEDMIASQNLGMQDWLMILYRTNNLMVSLNEGQKGFLQASSVWEKIPDWNKKLRSDAIFDEVRRLYFGLFSESTIQYSLFLKSKNQLVNKQKTLGAVKSHPLWRRLIKSFRYKALEKDLSKIFDQLHASRYIAIYSDEIIESLEEEKTILEYNIQLRKAVVRKLRFLYPKLNSQVDKSWADLKEEDLLKAIDQVAIERIHLQKKAQALIEIIKRNREHLTLNDLMKEE